MVYIILGAGFEEIEAVTPCDILRRGGVKVCCAAAGKSKTVEGGHGIKLEADELVSSISPGKGDYIVIPGGMGGVNSITADKAAMNMIRNAASAGCRLAAICAGPSVLAKLGLLEGKAVTCYPGCEDLMEGASCDVSRSTVLDGTLLTGRAPGAATDFGLSLLEIIAGAETALEVSRALVY